MTPLSWADISLSALVSNFQLLSTHNSTAKTMAVIKADAYGHGAIKAAKALSPYCEMFAVARVEEAIALREQQIQQDISVLSGAAFLEQWQACARHKLIPAICSMQALDELLRSGLSLRIWLKIDTGMHRLGIAPDDLAQAISKLGDQTCITLFGVLSHLSSADHIDNTKNQRQVAIFEQAVANLPLQNFSLANSAALLFNPNSHFEWLRPGIALYGAAPSDSLNEQSLRLLPVMTLKSRVIQIQQLKKGESVGYGETWQAAKDSTIATIAIGYADGYPRHAKNGTPVLIKQQRFPLAGRVSMDLITVDVSGADINRGDEVILWGEGLPIEEIASASNTINYELLSKVTARVPRIYHP